MNRMPRVKPHRNELKPGECLCDYCSAKCCRYFALPIDEPHTMKDFEFMRWYLLHGQASIFVDEGIWYLLVHTVCKHLQEDHRCGAYHTRPEICREYSTDECEYEDDYTYEQYFETPEQLHEFAQARFSQPTGPEFRSPRPEMFPVLN